MLNVDFIEFQRSIKNLILTQESLKSSENNKFITQFAVMNKVIMAKEKCNLIILYKKFWEILNLIKIIIL